MKLTVGAALNRLAEVRKAELVALEALAAALENPEPGQCVSQRTSERLLGIPRRAFLELVRQFDSAGGEVIATGKLRLVRLQAFEAWLRERSLPSVSATPANGEGTFDSELGLLVVGGGR
jgi:hypothetical protein